MKPLGLKLEANLDIPNFRVLRYEFRVGHDTYGVQTHVPDMIDNEPYEVARILENMSRAIIRKAQDVGL